MLNHFLKFSSSSSKSVIRKGTSIRLVPSCFRVRKKRSTTAMDPLRPTEPKRGRPGALRRGTKIQAVAAQWPNDAASQKPVRARRRPSPPSHPQHGAPGCRRAARPTNSNQYAPCEDASGAERSSRSRGRTPTPLRKTPDQGGEQAARRGAAPRSWAAVLRQEVFESAVGEVDFGGPARGACAG